MSLYLYLALTGGIMAAVIALTYMLGKILNNKKLVGQARVWMGDFVENIIVLVLVALVYSVSHGVVHAVMESLNIYTILNVQPAEPIDLMIEFLHKALEGSLHLTKSIAQVKHVIEFLSNLKENWGFPGVDVTLNFYNAADYYAGPADWALRIGAMIYVSVQAQTLLLTMVKWLAYPLLMFALVFRFLNIFRGVANMLIGIVLSYGIILPSLYLVLLAAYSSTLTVQFNLAPFEPAHTFCWHFLHTRIFEILSLFLPIIPYAGPCILELYTSLAAIGVAVLVIPTFVLSVANAFVDALAYMLNLEYRAGVI